MSDKQKLMFIGDSLIEFHDWRTGLPDYAVYNFGIAGETVEGLFSRLEGVLLQSGTPDSIFIMTGINNIAMGDINIQGTYGKLIALLRRKYPSSKVYMHSLLPVLFPMISNDEIVEVNQRLKSLAEKEHVFYIDIHSLFLDEKGNPIRSYLLEDGVHVSDAGYDVWSELVRQLVSSQA
jgi:lysophospholipase L1-like esterase